MIKVRFKFDIIIPNDEDPKQVAGQALTLLQTLVQDNNWSLSMIKEDP